MKHKKYVEINNDLDLIYHNIDSICRDVKAKLDNEYNKYNGNITLYSEISLKAASYTLDRIINLEKGSTFNIRTEIVPTEIMHNSNFNSYYWPIEHYIVKIISNNETVYVDPSSFLLKNINKYICSYYVSDKKPWYLLLDENNIRFKKPFKFINNIQLSVKLKGINEPNKTAKIGIISFCQFIIWGSLSDIIFNLKE